MTPLLILAIVLSLELQPALAQPFAVFTVTVPSLPTATLEGPLISQPAVLASAGSTL
jgi:hypothetical protein